MTLPQSHQRVLELMFIGKTDDEIADITGASEALVALTVEYLVQELDADNRFNAIYNALVEGILTPPAPKRLHLYGLELDSNTHEVLANGKPVHLSVAEFKLLRMLMTHPGRVFSRWQIIDGIKGQACTVELRMVDVHVSRLREALGDCAYLVETERGLGYRFRSQERVMA